MIRRAADEFQVLELFAFGAGAPHDFVGDIRPQHKRAFTDDSGDHSGGKAPATGQVENPGSRG